MEKLHAQTGPVTAAGKEISNSNATTHGGTSEKLIVAGERRPTHPKRSTASSISRKACRPNITPSPIAKTTAAKETTPSNTGMIVPLGEVTRDEQELGTGHARPG